MGKRGRPDPSDAVRARILVESELPGASDAKVAARYGVDVRSVRRWRAELADRPELEARVRELREEGYRAWAGNMKRAMAAMLDRQVAMLAKLEPEQFGMLTAAATKLADIIAQHEVLVVSRVTAETAREQADRGDPPSAAPGAVAAERNRAGK